MKALAIFNAVAAVKIFRMQSNRDGNQHVIKPANAEPIVKKDSDYEGASAVGNFLLPEEAFKFTLTCNGLTKANCEQAQQILEKAGREIAQVINFKKPINVNATFSPFCPNNGKCAISGRLGQASPSCKYAAFDDVHGLLMYPQPLVKQASSNMDTDYNPFDIVADFNSQYPFYFGTNDSIGKDHVDFESVHELTHGLGLLSSLLEYKKDMNRSVAYLAPPILQSESKKYSFFAPINIYDSLLLGSEPFKIILQVISGTKREMMTPKQYMTSFESGPRFAEAKKLLKLALNQTYIAVNKTHGVRNYSPDEFEPGSSISHLEKVNENGPEFLMVPSIAKGITLSALKKKFNMTTAYGPETKAIMEKLGYSTSDNPNELKLNISLTFGSDNYKPSFEYKSNRSMSQPSLGPKSKRPSKKRKTKKPSSSNFMDTLKGLVGKSKSASSGIRHSTLLSTVTLAWIFFNTI